MLHVYATTKGVQSDPSLQVLPGTSIYFCLKLFAHLSSWGASKASPTCTSIFISGFVIAVLDHCRALHQTWHHKSLKSAGWAEHTKCCLCFLAVPFLMPVLWSLSLCLVLKMLVTQGYLQVIHTFIWCWLSLPSCPGMKTSIHSHSLDFFFCSHGDL